MANDRDSIDFHNGRNGDFTGTSWPAVLGQEAFLLEVKEKRRQAARAKAEIEAHEQRFAVRTVGGGTSVDEDAWGSYWLTGTIILSLVLGLLGFNPLLGVALSACLMALCVATFVIVLCTMLVWRLLQSVWRIGRWTIRFMQCPSPQSRHKPKRIDSDR